MRAFLSAGLDAVRWGLQQSSGLALPGSRVSASREQSGSRTPVSNSVPVSILTSLGQSAVVPSRPQGSYRFHRDEFESGTEGIDAAAESTLGFISSASMPDSHNDAKRTPRPRTSTSKSRRPASRLASRHTQPSVEADVGNTTVPAADMHEIARRAKIIQERVRTRHLCMLTSQLPFTLTSCVLVLV